MQLLVTGGAGFIGSNLIRLALERGHEITVIDDLSTGYAENLADLDVRFVEGSILDPVALADAVEGAESVVHMAALGSVPRSIENPERTHEVNATGTLAVLRAAHSAGVKHAVVASSSSVYGLNPALPKSEREWVRPLSPYAVSKLATEQYALAFQQSYGMSTLAFRFFNVYGPRQRAGHPYAAVIPIFIDALLRQTPLPVNGDGKNSRDFTFVDTVTTILLDAAERRISHPEPVNLAFGTNTSIQDLVEILGKISGSPIEKVYTPARPGDVPHSMAANDTLMRLFPSVSSIDIETGLGKTMQWMRSVVSG